MKIYNKGTAAWRRKFKKGTAAFSRRKTTQAFQRAAEARREKERNMNGRKHPHPRPARTIRRA